METPVQATLAYLIEYEREAPCPYLHGLIDALKASLEGSDHN